VHLLLAIYGRSSIQPYPSQRAEHTKRDCIERHEAGRITYFTQQSLVSTAQQVTALVTTIRTYPNICTWWAMQTKDEKQNNNNNNNNSHKMHIQFDWIHLWTSLIYYSTRHPVPAWCTHCSSNPFGRANKKPVKTHRKNMNKINTALQPRLFTDSTTFNELGEHPTRREGSCRSMSKWGNWFNNERKPRLVAWFHWPWRHRQIEAVESRRCLRRLSRSRRPRRRSLDEPSSGRLRVVFHSRNILRNLQSANWNNQTIWY